MIKINRKENPSFTHYSETIVRESIKKDFFKKCYLCEEVTRHFEVEHFYPQTHYLHLINEYTNLFYCCQKCNKIKPKKINIDSENEMLNCCDIDPEKYIKLKYRSSDGYIEVTQIDSKLNYNKQIEYTIKILDRIYNGKKTKSDSFIDLRTEVKLEIESFRKKIDKYKRTKLKRAALNELQLALEISSSYSTFKRWIIKDNNSLKKEFGRYINDV